MKIYISKTDYIIIIFTKSDIPYGFVLIYRGSGDEAPLKEGCEGNVVLYLLQKGRERLNIFSIFCTASRNRILDNRFEFFQFIDFICWNH